MWGISLPTEPPDKEPAKEQEWGVRDGVPHFADEALPQGVDAYTDYRDRNRFLTKKPVNEMARPVRVVEPLDRGQRARIDKTPSGTFEARPA